MNQHSEQSLRKLDVSETYNIDEESRSNSDNESFGDLEQHAQLQNEQTQTIVIDEQTLKSNDLLVHQQEIHPQTIEKKLSSSQKQAVSQVATCSQVGKENQTFYQELINKLKQHNFNEQSLQESYEQFEANQKKYLLKIKILYSHFIIKDKQLTLNQFHHLKTLLFVPKYGENLVNWGNKKYGCTYTLPLALQRLEYMQRLAGEPTPKLRCKQQLRVFGMLLLIILLIKLIS